MLTEWMAYATVFTVLIYVAALAAERVVAIWERARRAVWALALAVASLSPVAIALVAPAPTALRLSARAAPTLGSTATRVSALPGVRDVSPSRAWIARRVTPIASGARAAAPTLDRYAVAMWICASLGLFGVFTRSVVRLRRRRLQWREAELDGATVLLSCDTGPAVVNVLRPAIVVPEWALGLDVTARQLMLRHEAEHIAAGDPRLLLAGAVALVLFPWNAGLWILVRRLRLAIEVDCDARVLRRSVRWREYGMLLLAVGARRGASLPFAASLAARRPLLELRIRAMTEPRPRAPRTMSLALVGVIVAASTAASHTPRPASLVVRPDRPEVTRPTPEPAARAIQLVAPTAPDEPTRVSEKRTPSRSRPRAPLPEQSPEQPPEESPAPRQAGVAEHRTTSLPVPVIRALIAAHHPAVLQGDTSVNVVMIVVNANSEYVTSKTGRVPEAEVTRSGTADAYQYVVGVSPTMISMSAMIRLQPKIVIDGRDYLSLRVNGTPSSNDDLVEEDTIKKLDILRFGPGSMRPTPLGVVVITLK
jgi:beta-lactamase regulating signal transducer with metallopeptidase domain